MTDRATPAEPIAEASSEGRSYLFVIQNGSSSVLPIPAEGEIVIGSAESASLRLEDPCVADHHAKLVAASDEVTVIALGGDRETLVNRERLAGGRALASGDVIAIGGATLVFRSKRERAVCPLVGWDEVRRRVAEEAARSLRYGRSLAVIVLDLGSEGLFDHDLLARALEHELRPTDVIGWDGARSILAVLPETGDTAVTPASRLLRALEPITPGVRAGVAICPHDACDVEALVAGAAAAAQSAAPAATARVEDSVSRWVLDGRPVLVADPVMKRLLALVERLARSDLPVLVVGESGVGKEIVASALHAWSPRRAERFVAINCAAIPETLLESELFGHERGAFSGATAAKMGLLEAAHGGTIFLDEVGECPPGQQAKLLRVLETKRVMRLGSTTERAVDVRIVAATNRSLEAEVEAGRFRRDLFFRLRAAAVVVPPLRERLLDLPVLARAFLAEACERLGRPTPTISPAVIVRLSRHTWDGNLRELKNTIEYLAATADASILEPRHLPDAVARAAPPWMAGGRDAPELALREAPLPAPPPEARRPRRLRNLYEEIRELERARIIEALEASDGARALAAELIGVPLRTFVTKLKEYGIDIPARRADSGVKRQDA